MRLSQSESEVNIKPDTTCSSHYLHCSYHVFASGVVSPLRTAVGVLSSCYKSERSKMIKRKGWLEFVKFTSDLLISGSFKLLVSVLTAWKAENFIRSRRRKFFNKEILKSSRNNEPLSLFNWDQWQRLCFGDIKCELGCWGDLIGSNGPHSHEFGRIKECGFCYNRTSINPEELNKNRQDSGRYSPTDWKLLRLHFPLLNAQHHRSLLVGSVLPFSHFQST